ncbi:glucan biosynthesis protein G [Kushneria aurantia]|uniref:Glucans biosynthesis protein G n=1 Tax=Kushneria aurantia TaxID=504092 RepID=A0ABV6G6G9_9GAMM|nr:glucan biosynthesis protein G [Kushneria aurantia]
MKKKGAVYALGMAALLSSFPLFAFDFEDVSQQAQELAQRSYSAPQNNLPDALANLGFADYQKIQYKPAQSHWRDDDLRFDLSFFHEGMHYNTPVTVNAVDGDSVNELQFSPSNFNYGDLNVDPSQFQNLGFAGFSINYGADPHHKQETMVFLGASYFRVASKGQRYGLSGRGLAIDTGLNSGEEFPRFSEFWVVKPQPEDRYLIIYALLDSPSATGAYRFVLRPGSDTQVDVKSRLFLRRQVSRLGIAPLTSMYLYGSAQPASQLNFRPAIHDSEGLLLAGQDGQWLWRPLANPARLSDSSYPASSPRGFGLLQRDHQFDAYQDVENRYDLRPSAWIEPQGNWGEGQLALIQIPTPDETNDNIVSFWQPSADLPTNQPLDYNYTINWTLDEARYHNPDLGWVAQTRRSRGEVIQDNLVRQSDDSTMFVVDFVGPPLKSTDNDGNIRANLDVGDNGELVRSQVVRNPAMGGYRLKVSVKAKDTAKPVDIKAYLESSDSQSSGQNGQSSAQRLTETWNYVLPANG